MQLENDQIPEDIMRLARWTVNEWKRLGMSRVGSVESVAEQFMKPHFLPGTRKKIEQLKRKAKKSS